MGTFAVGDVVVIPFPYADFSKFKKRPALVVGQAEFENLILCQITSKANTSRQAIALLESDFARGSLSLKSYIRPDKLFTIESSVIERKVGSLKPAKMRAVNARVKSLFS